MGVAVRGDLTQLLHIPCRPKYLGAVPPTLDLDRKITSHFLWENRQLTGKTIQAYNIMHVVPCGEGRA